MSTEGFLSEELTLSDTIFRVIDIEGTHREPHLAKICEIAFYDVDANGVCHGAGSWITNPGCPIPPETSAVHHITDEMVDGKPGAEEYLDLLVAEVYAAHNIDYDATVLGALDPMFDRNAEVDPVPWIDTERLAKHIWPELPSHGVQYLRYALKLNVNLPRRAGGHTAMNDATVTAAILVEALKHVPQKMPGVQTVKQLISEISKPVLLVHIPFKNSSGLFEFATTDHLEWIVDHGAGGPDCVYSARYWLQKRYEEMAQRRREMGNVLSSALDDVDDDLPF